MVWFAAKHYDEMLFFCLKKTSCCQEFMVPCCCQLIIKSSIFCQKLLPRVNNKMMLPADNEMEVLSGEELLLLAGVRIQVGTAAT